MNLPNIPYFTELQQETNNNYAGFNHSYSHVDHHDIVTHSYSKVLHYKQNYIVM